MADYTKEYFIKELNDFYGMMGSRDVMGNTDRMEAASRGLLTVALNCDYPDAVAHANSAVQEMYRRWNLMALAPMYAR